jgi:eukaryotic-like serine/threonine-protein kinase
MIEKTLGHYRVGEQLGRGGMGEVYLADDLNLNRKVALKFLPDAFAGDPERMARFEREAKLLASLNHTNIAAIYGLEQAEGKRFLVLELVEGETLAQRISKGALPVEEALAICRQIAEGLEAAHEKGVIHRDLKPANVMITEEDKVKVLDFGLAKALSEEAQSIDSSQSPTLTEAMTRPGVILGTAAYMSPEQAKGKAVDKRADIWAFGCILYECLTGKRAFDGETVTDTLASILKAEPDWNALPRMTQPSVGFALRRCLEKDVSHRFRDAADIRIQIEEIRYTAELPVSGNRPWPVRIWASTAILALVALAVLGFLYFGGRTPAEMIQFHIPVPPMLNEYGMAISPDGRTLAFLARSSRSVPALFVREIGSVAPRQLDGTEGAEHPFWSPDSSSIGFFAEGRLKWVEASGGLPRDICAAASSWGGTWNQSGIIVFSAVQGPLYSVSAAGGEPTAITALDNSEKEQGHYLPNFLPDGQHYLFTSYRGGSTRHIYLGSLGSKAKTRLLTDVAMAAYAKPGYLLFYRGKTLFAQPFDARKLLFAGEPVGIADNLLVDRYGVPSFGISQTGVLIHRSGAGYAQSQFFWVDRKGNRLGSAGDPGMYQETFDLSPDGKKIAIAQIDPGTSKSDIWIIEWEKRNVPTRLTFDGAVSAVAWSPDGLKVGYSSSRKGNSDIYEKQSSGIGNEKLLVDSSKDAWAEDWSKDGKYIAYDLGMPTDLFVVPLFGDRKPFPIVQSPLNQDQSHFSFNGKWLAYGSNESGTWQIYVDSFPAVDQKRQVSTSGGAQPLWSQDGKELYYLSLDGKMIAVDIRVGAGIETGAPHVLFDTGLSVGPNLDQYAVSPDGNRFLLLLPAEESATTPITVVINWTSLINK